LKFKWLDKEGDLATKHPFLIILRGAAIPGMFVALFGIVGFFMGNAKTGLLIGFFISLIGGAELAVSVLVAYGFNRVGFYLSFGALLTWLTTLFFLIGF